MSGSAAKFSSSKEPLAALLDRERFAIALRCRYCAQIRLAQEAVGRHPSLVWPDDQEAELQEALFQEALLQEAEFHEAEFHEALFHEALFHDAFAVAALDQLAASNVRVPLESVTTYALSPAFGFGGVVTAAAAVACTSPTPSA